MEASHCRRRFAEGREEPLSAFLGLVFADMSSATASHQSSALRGVSSCQRRNRRLTAGVNLGFDGPRRRWTTG